MVALPRPRARRPGSSSRRRRRTSRRRVRSARGLAGGSSISASNGWMTDMPRTRSISVIITAMNEVGNLEPTLASVRAAVGPRFGDYEIIIVDDGSKDGTSELADKLAAVHPRIIVHHNGANCGLAASYRKGIELATKDHTSWVAGNNIVPERGLADLYDA